MNQQEINKAIAVIKEKVTAAQNAEQALVAEHAALNSMLSKQGSVILYQDAAAKIGAFFCVSRLLMLSFGYTYKQVKPSFKLSERQFQDLKVTSNFGFMYDDCFEE